MKRVNLDQIEKKYPVRSYQELYEKVLLLMEKEKIKPVKASGKNGKKPALYKEYWVIEKTKDVSKYIEELSYLFVPSISTAYYLKHLDRYEEDRKWLFCLNHYLKEESEKLKIPKSMNERSFEIWHREKFLKEEQGKKILKRCGLTLDDLNLYETTEPLAYYVHTKNVPQNMLIIENKDTFYSMRKRLLGGEDTILGVKIGTLIYGAGKGIFRSFQDFSLCAEPYMRKPENVIYYFGDMDYEGIRIYETFADSFGDTYQIRPFIEGYQKMLAKVKQIGEDVLPKTKEGQNQNIQTEFLDAFEKEQSDTMKRILQAGTYIPQEILSLEDF
ncbi:MAG: Wadjet anti-phage system protein JetD domain-containing protein [Lachnospiraceae bacterium]